jgi:hypothetical protein
MKMTSLVLRLQRLQRQADAMTETQKRDNPSAVEAVYTVADTITRAVKTAERERDTRHYSVSIREGGRLVDAYGTSGESLSLAEVEASARRRMAELGCAASAKLVVKRSR